MSEKSKVRRCSFPRCNRLTVHERCDVHRNPMPGNEACCYLWLQGKHDEKLGAALESAGARGGKQ